MWKANVLSPINSTHFLRASIVQSPLHKPPETALSSRFLLRARASKERLGGALAIFLPLVIPGPSCGECDSVGRPSSSGLSLRWPSHKIDRDALWSCWLFSVIDIPSIFWWFFIFLMKFRTGKKKERKKNVFIQPPRYVYMCWAPVTSGSPGKPSDEALPSKSTSISPWSQSLFEWCSSTAGESLLS